MIVPGQALRFSKEDRALIGGELRSAIEELEEQHSGLYKEIRERWEYYDAEPLVKERTRPFRGAANTVVPTVAIHSDATVARYLRLMQGGGQRVWWGKSENDEFNKAGYTRELVRWLNLSGRLEYDLMGPIQDTLLELVVIGDGVFRGGWRRQTGSFFLPPTGRGKRGKVETVTIREGPYIEHIPRERALWDINYPAWDSPIFSFQSYLSWGDLIRKVNQNGWDGEAVESIKHQQVTGSGSYGASHKIQTEKAKRHGIRVEEWMALHTYDIRETWWDWPVVNGVAKTECLDEAEEGDDLVAIVFFTHMPSGTVLHITNKPYILPGNPFYSSHYKKRTGQATGQGLGRILRDFQAGQTKAINQSFDVVDIANSMPGVTTSHRLANAEFEVGKWQLIEEGESFTPLNQGKFIAPDIALIRQLDVMAERRSGINDPALGRETRLGGHPAPATSTLQLLREGRVLDILAMGPFRRAVSRWGQDKLALYQQLETDMTKFDRMMGAEDAALLRDVLFNQPHPIGPNLELDLAAVDEVMNPQEDQQRAILTFQATTNFYAVVQQHSQVAANPSLPPAVRAVSLKAIEGLGKSFEKILETNDIDDLNSFILDLQQLSQLFLVGQQQAVGAAGGAAGQLAPNASGGGVGRGNGSDALAEGAVG